MVADALAVGNRGGFRAHGMSASGQEIRVPERQLLAELNRSS
jgi:hypothetical protein